MSDKLVSIYFKHEHITQTYALTRFAKIEYIKPAYAKVDGEMMQCFLFKYPEGGSVFNYLQERQRTSKGKVPRHHIKKIIL